MHRQPLLNALAEYRAKHTKEAAVADRIAALVTAHEECFDRTCLPGHVTGSAWVLSADRRRCLMLHHRKLDRWLQPGGHADGDPDTLAVALREASEESGLSCLEPLNSEPFDLDVHLIPARYAPDGRLIEAAHEHHDVRYLIGATDNASLVVSEESHDVRWATPDEVRRLTQEESVLRMLEKSGPFMMSS